MDDLVGPLQTECEVNVSLQFILHLSRLACTSPLKFERVNGVCRVRVSRLYHAFFCVVQIIFAIAMVLYTFDRDNVDDGYESSRNTQFMRTVLTVYLVMHVAVGSAITITGLSRMRTMIDCIARLRQINAEMDRLYEPSKSNEKTKICIIIISHIFAYYTVCFEYGVYISDALYAGGTVQITSYLAVSVFLSIAQEHTFVVQFSVVIMDLVSTQQRLNNCLKSMLQDLQNNHENHVSASPSVPRPSQYEYGQQLNLLTMPDIKRNVPKSIPNHMITCVIDLMPQILKRELKTDPVTIDRLIDMYCTMCGMIRELNESNGAALLAMLAFVTAHALTAPYFVVSISLRMKTASATARISSLMSWFFLCMAMLTMACECCHRSHIQLWKTRRLIRRIRRFAFKSDPEATRKWRQFQRHIELNPVRFAPLKLLTFNRGLILAVLSGIVTYLSVVMDL